MPNTRYRIPRKDADFLLFLQRTVNHLKEPFLEEATATVAALTTVNLGTADFTEQLEVTIENTGPVAAPDLYFCIVSEDDEACDTDTAIVVAQGETVAVIVKQLGSATLHELNVTNIHPTDSSSCKVTFPLNWKRLGLLQEHFDTWKNFQDNWIAKYLLTQNPATRTTTITAEKNSLKDDFIAFAEAPMNIIAASYNLTQTDRDIFNIPERDRTPTPRAAITEAPFTDLKGGDGCMVSFTHRVSGDASRSSIHPDADGVETKWVLLDSGAPAPGAPAECPNTEFSSKAIHSLDFGIENAGKRLHSFSRWRNNSEAQKSSPWGQRMTVVLSD